MKQRKLYLETSVINFLDADDVIERRDLTRKMLEMIKKDEQYEIYISDLLFKEIDRAKEERKKELLKVLKENEFLLLSRTEESDRLGEIYVKEGLIPEKYIDDAYHIAIASMYEMHAIISWNFKHIVKMRVIELVPAVNKIHGYGEIKIYSPEEVMGDYERE